MGSKTKTRSTTTIDPNTTTRRAVRGMRTRATVTRPSVVDRDIAAGKGSRNSGPRRRTTSSSRSSRNTARNGGVTSPVTCEGVEENSAAIGISITCAPGSGPGSGAPRRSKFSSKGTRRWAPSGRRWRNSWSVDRRTPSRITGTRRCGVKRTRRAGRRRRFRR